LSAVVVSLAKVTSRTPPTADPDELGRHAAASDESTIVRFAVGLGVAEAESGLPDAAFTESALVESARVGRPVSAATREAESL
jgi:hypothetical protein